MNTRIRKATEEDVPPIQRIAVAAGMFAEEEVGFIGEMLTAHCHGDTPEAHWLAVEGPAGELVGAAYYAPEPFADRMWNLYFIAVAPEHHGTGIGTALMRHIEVALTDLGEAVARTLVVETSSTSQYDRTRAFYSKLGYDQEARIRQFYGPEDDKIVFWKSLVAQR